MEGARPALPGDLAACAVLLEEARDRARTSRGGPELLAAHSLPPESEPIDGRWLAEHWSGPGHLVVAGTIDDVVVGVGAGRLTTRGAERIGTIDCCYVEADARGVGVGAAIAGTLVRLCSDAGCVALDAPALPGDRATKQLFESQGLSARLVVLHRRLP